MLVRYAVIGLLAGIAPAKAQIVHEDLTTSSVKVEISTPITVSAVPR
jgi:hypothetical protein